MPASNLQSKKKLHLISQMGAGYERNTTVEVKLSYSEIIGAVRNALQPVINKRMRRDW